jgi:hypothetical protein
MVCSGQDHHDEAGCGVGFTTSTGSTIPSGMHWLDAAGERLGQLMDQDCTPAEM